MSILAALILVALLGVYYADWRSEVARKATEEKPYSGIATDTWFGPGELATANWLEASNATGEVVPLVEWGGKRAESGMSTDDAVSTNADRGAPAGAGSFVANSNQVPPAPTLMPPESLTVNITNAPVTPPGLGTGYSGR